jgi:DNA polymerase-3 subunit alpha
MFADLDAVIASSASAQRDRAAGQSSLFGDIAPAPSPQHAASFTAPPWPKAEMLGYEKELLGFYVTGHPLDEFRAELESGKFRPVSSLAEMDDRATVQVAGSLVAVEKKFTKKDGKPFAITTLEDLTGGVEMMVWSEAYLKYASHLELGRVIAVTARVDKREEAARLVASEIAPLKASAGANGSGKTKPVILRLPRASTTENDLVELKKAIEQFPGARPLVIEFVNGGNETLRMKLGAEFNVELSPELRIKLGTMLVSA